MLFMKMMMTIAIVGIGIIILLSIGPTIGSAGTQEICKQRAAAKMDLIKQLEEGGFSDATVQKKLDELDEAFELGWKGWFISGEPDFDPDDLEESMLRMGEISEGHLNEAFYLGPECGIMVFIEGPKEAILYRIVDEIATCYELGISGTEPKTCVYTFTMKISDEEIDECDVAQEIYYTYPLTWGDLEDYPRDYTEVGCKVDEDPETGYAGENIRLSDPENLLWELDTLDKDITYHFTIFYMPSITFIPSTKVSSAVIVDENVWGMAMPEYYVDDR